MGVRVAHRDPGDVRLGAAQEVSVRTRRESTVDGIHYRRRKKTEEKAKGRRCCLGDEIDSISCRIRNFPIG